MAHAVVVLVGMPVPAERASRVPVNTPSTRAAVYFPSHQPRAPSLVHSIDGPLPLMRPQPLEACTSVMGLHSTVCVRSGEDSKSDAQ